MPPRKNKETFEELFRRLEETVAKLEEGGLPLDHSLALYEEGMLLAKRCQEMLDNAEVRIRQLRQTLTQPPAVQEVDADIPWDGHAES